MENRKLKYNLMGRLGVVFMFGAILIASTSGDVISSSLVYFVGMVGYMLGGGKQ